jgi:virulence family protein
MKTKNKIVSLALASALLTTSAFSQVTVSGYVETSILTGNTKQAAGSTNPVIATKSIGNESVIRVAGTGKMPNGQNASMYVQVDSDNTGIIHERGFDVGIANGVNFVYGFDRVFGSEIARTLTPYASLRIQDVTQSTGTSELQDVTSGEHAVGFNLNDLIGKGSSVSFAYAPNMDSATGTTNDGLINTNSQSGYGAGVRLTPIAGLTVGGGYTKADSKNALNQDLTSKTLGFTYAQAPFAIGLQRTKTEGQKAAALATANSVDEVDVISVTWAATKDITLGFARSEMDRTRTTKSTVDAEVNLFSIAYNLGPVVVSLDHERAEDIAAATTSNNVAGNDTNLTKAKVRVAF